MVGFGNKISVVDGLMEFFLCNLEKGNFFWWKTGLVNIFYSLFLCMAYISTQNCSTSKLWRARLCYLYPEWSWKLMSQVSSISKSKMSPAKLSLGLIYFFCKNEAFNIFWAHWGALKTVGLNSLKNCQSSFYFCSKDIQYIQYIFKK